MFETVKGWFKMENKAVEAAKAFYLTTVSRFTGNGADERIAQVLDETDPTKKYSAIRATFNALLVSAAIGAEFKDTKDGSGNFKISWIHKIPSEDDAKILAQLADNWNRMIESKFVSARDDMGLGGELPLIDVKKVTKKEFVSHINSAISNTGLTGTQVLEFVELAKKFKFRQNLIIGGATAGVVLIGLGGYWLFIRKKPDKEALPEGEIVEDTYNDDDIIDVEVEDAEIVEDDEITDTPAEESK